MVQDLGELQHVTLIDLSVPISPATAEPGPPHIDYVDHARSARELAAICTQLYRQGKGHDSTVVIPENAFKDGIGLANENIELDTHAGTHMDAPWHFGPTCESKPSKTIDQIPLEW